MLCFTLYLRVISSPQEASVRRGDLTEVFYVTGLGGLYLEGLIFGMESYEKHLGGGGGVVGHKSMAIMVLGEIYQSLSTALSHFERRVLHIFVAD